MSGGWTPVPNRLVDDAMPRLRDTEWRLLCIIVRETIGRRDSDGERQRRAWLSQKLLKRKTGRQSEAISRAIDVLCRSGLIEVRNAIGLPLLTRKARLRYRGNIRLGLHPTIQAEVSTTEIRKANSSK